MATTVTVAAQSTTSTPSTPIAKALSASPPTKKAGSNSIFLGGIASMVAACTTHPLDLLKVRLQTQISSGGSVLTTVSNILRNEGILALYAGLSASLLRQATYSTARFGGYEFLKDRAIRNSSPHSSELPLYQKVSFSLVSGAAGGVIGNPADVVNVRMQADGKLPLAERRNYAHAIDGLIRITRENGVLALWRGVGPNVARGMLMTAGQLASYDQFKGWMLHSGYFHDGLTTHFLASTAAGVVATVMTAPVDVVKTRVMNARAGEQLKTLECFGRILKHEGIMGFYKGFVPAFIRLGPHTIVTFITLEKLKQWL